MELSDIKDLIEQQGRAFEEFKRANDARIEAMEKRGFAPADLEEKVDKINAELGRLSAEIKSASDKLNVVETRMHRPGVSGDVDPVKEEHRKAFARYFRKGDESGLHEIEQKALMIGSDPDGGYLVPDEVESTVDRVLAKTVAMRRIAQVRVIGAAAYRKPVVISGAAYGWIGETENSAETGIPRVSELEFVPGKIYAEPWATNDMLEDAMIDIESWLVDETTISFAEGENEAFIFGDGVKKPRGLLSYPTVANASYTWGSIGYVPSGASGDFASTNPSDRLFDLVHALKRGYRNGASWLMTDMTLSRIRKFKDGQGNYLWQPGLQAGVADMLLGYPVETDDMMPEIAANSLSIAFGNFRRAYLIVDRRGVAVIRDNVTRKGYTKFHTTRRVGGGVQNFEAVKLMKFATS